MEKIKTNLDPLNDTNTKPLKGESKSQKQPSKLMLQVNFVSSKPWER